MKKVAGLLSVVIPFLVLAIAVAAMLGPGLFNLILVLVIMPFGVGTISPLMMTIPFELKGLPRSAAGSAMGMIFTFQNIGAFAYPIFSGWLIYLFCNDRINSTYLFR